MARKPEMTGIAKVPGGGPPPQYVRAEMTPADREMDRAWDDKDALLRAVRILQVLRVNNRLQHRELAALESLEKSLEQRTAVLD